MLECNITYQINVGAPSRGSSPQGKGHEMAMVPSAVGGRSIRTNLKDVVADHIRNLIFSGQLRPGQKVDQDEIAEVLGVSKLPVREALIVLENEALVRGVPRRGVFVAPLTPDDVFDHYEIYGMVEGIAARRAAQNLSDAELEKLAEITAQMHKDDLPERQEKLNYEFHRTIEHRGRYAQAADRAARAVQNDARPAFLRSRVAGLRSRGTSTGRSRRRCGSATVPRPSKRCTSTSCRVASTP